MANHFLNWVFANSAAAGAERAVLLALADRAGADGRCFPGVGDIARRTGLSERQVRRYLSRLVERGEVRTGDRKGGRRGDGRGIASVYVIVGGRAESDLRKLIGNPDADVTVKVDADVMVSADNPGREPGHIGRRTRSFLAGNPDTDVRQTLSNPAAEPQAEPLGEGEANAAAEPDGQAPDVAVSEPTAQNAPNAANEAPDADVPEPTAETDACAVAKLAELDARCEALRAQCAGGDELAFADLCRIGRERTALIQQYPTLAPPLPECLRREVEGTNETPAERDARFAEAEAARRADNQRRAVEVDEAHRRLREAGCDDAFAGEVAAHLRLRANPLELCAGALDKLALQNGGIRNPAGWLRSEFRRAGVLPRGIHEAAL